MATVPSDAGIALESFDRPAAADLAPPVDWLEQEQTRSRLREIDRKLNASQATNAGVAVTPSVDRPWTEAAPTLATTDVPLRSVARQAAAEPTVGRSRTPTSWLLSLLLTSGVICFGVGASMLAWSAAFQLPQLWQQGMSVTIGAEGLLILSLTWMAARLWRNGRRVNRQLHGVDRQLAEIEQLTGTLAGNQLASSQHYYHHFGQVASPHLLVANLQGQVDLMASRLASEG